VGPTKADTQAEKDRLCDIPQTFDLSRSATPDELNALWSEGLEQRRVQV